MKSKTIYTVIITIFISATSLTQQDIEGCKDHPIFNRINNFFITDCSENYNEAILPTSSNETITKEGTVTKITYTFNYESGTNPPSTLQVIKNYENAVIKNRGKKIYSNTEEGNATLTMTAKDIEYWLMINRTSGDPNICEEFNLYVIEIEAMNQEIQASEMFDALNKEGFVALYINFETGKAEIKSESKKIIDQIVLMLKDNPELKVNIEGHTDNVGSVQSNQTLSEKRAEAVMKVLISDGIDSSRLSSRGWGQNKPIADNETEEGRSKNRRVEIVKR